MSGCIAEYPVQLIIIISPPLLAVTDPPQLPQWLVVVVVVILRIITQAGVWKLIGARALIQEEPCVLCIMKQIPMGWE